MPPGFPAPLQANADRLGRARNHVRPDLVRALANAAFQALIHLKRLAVDDVFFISQHGGDQERGGSKPGNRELADSIGARSNGSRAIATAQQSRQSFRHTLAEAIFLTTLTLLAVPTFEFFSDVLHWRAHCHGWVTE
jgi:hypothetical protein